MQSTPPPDMPPMEPPPSAPAAAPRPAAASGARPRPAVRSSHSAPKSVVVTAAVAATAGLAGGFALHASLPSTPARPTLSPTPAAASGATPSNDSGGSYYFGGDDGFERSTQNQAIPAPDRSSGRPDASSGAS